MEEKQTRQIQYTIDNFVGVYEGLFSKKYCDDVITNFEDQLAAGFGHTRQEHDEVEKTIKDDTAVFSAKQLKLINPELAQHFHKVFWSTPYKIYADKFSALKESAKHTIYEIKIQKTEIGQGYHVWHYEAPNRELSDRVLTFILYLNDVEEGGETEFLYYPRRIKPTTGTFVLWPGSFTHTHRGNPPISNTKYIMTGWVQF